MLLLAVDDNFEQVFDAAHFVGYLDRIRLRQPLNYTIVWYNEREFLLATKRY